jgi:gliding motility-associated-like protein
MEEKCAPALVSFINESTTGNDIKYIWNFGKGAEIESSESILHEVYNTPGIYKITLKVVQSGDTVSSSQNLEVMTGPKALFSESPDNGCIPLRVTFTNMSTAGGLPITSVFWDLKNGFTSTDNNLVYTYTKSGTTDIYLKVIDQNGCSDFIEKHDIINALPVPLISFTASDSFSCRPPLRVSFANSSEGISSLNYLWKFGNGQTSASVNPTIDYTAKGNYTVSLIATDINGCTDSLVRNSYIRINDVSGEIHAKTGNRIVTEMNGVLCTGDIIFLSTIPLSGNFNWEVKYKGNTVSDSKNKQFKFNATDSGKIDVKLFININTECPDTLTKTFFVQKISADFDYNPMYTCQTPINVHLTNKSAHYTTIKWVLPDFTTTSASTVDYLVPVMKSYEIDYNHHLNNYSLPFKLIAYASTGCNDTVTKSVKVELPVARFMPDITEGCAPLKVVFSDSSISNEPITSRKYVIENKIYQTSKDTIWHTFNMPGIYTVKMMIENSAGCRDTSYEVSVMTGLKVSPDISISPASLCNGESLSIHTNVPSNGQKYSWQIYSPGVFNSGEITSPVYTVGINNDSIGVKDVIFSAENNGCVSDTVIKSIYTAKGPTGDIKEFFDCKSPFDYKFTASFSGANQLIWAIDDSTMPTTDTIHYTFKTPGDYLVRLSFKNTVTGCLIEKTKTIKVRQVDASYNVDPIACFGDSVTFNATNSVDYVQNCYREGFLWDYDDGTPPRRNFEPTHDYLYNDTGVYHPKLIVLADNGCIDTIRQTVEIVSPPVDFNATPLKGCGPNLKIDLDYYSINPTVENWTWYFGDFTSHDNSLTLSHIYNSSVDKKYKLVLEVTDKYGCRNSSVKEINYLRANASFYALDAGICLGDEATFVMLEDSVAMFHWDFGDGTGSNISNIHKYTQTGNYAVSLTVTKGTCTDTKTYTNYIKVEKADAHYLVSDTIFDCYPATVSFNYAGNTPDIYYGYWTFEPGVESPGFTSSADYTYTRPGTYLSSLLVKSNNNCTAKSTKTIIIDGPQAVWDFTPKQICRGDSVSFSIAGVYKTNDFEWIFGDGITSHDTNPPHNYQATGNLFPALRLKQNECEVTLTGLPLQVQNTTAVFELVPDKEKYCSGEIVITANKSVDNSGNIWSLDGSQISTNKNVDNLVFDRKGNYKLMLEVTSTIGCTDTVSKEITVEDNPLFEISGDSVICSNIDSSNLQVTENQNRTIEWFPSQYFTDPKSFNTFIKTDSTINVFAIVTDHNGCFSTVVYKIDVIPLPNLYRLPVGDTSIYLGETIQLHIFSDLDDLNYNWTPDENISCTSCTSPFANPKVTTTYVLNVSNNCFENAISYKVEVIVDFYLELPDAFTPNNDSQNDLFKIESKNIGKIDFKIFNRWGNLVYSSDDVNEGWNGFYRGKLQNSDTYTYTIEATTIHGYKFEKKGTFLLLY